MPEFGFTENAEALSVGSILVNLAICAGLTVAISWHFHRYSGAFSNRRKLARVLPIVALTTLFIISVVKSSIALSLGLVGALSIFRFRTPVKEPEELGYLFLAIGTGLCLGADQRLLAVAAVPLILGLLSLRHRVERRKEVPGMFLSIDLPRNGADGSELEEAMQLIRQHAERVDLRRVDVQEQGIQASMFLSLDHLDSLVEVQKDLQRRYPKSDLTFVEQSALPVP